MDNLLAKVLSICLMEEQGASGSDDDDVESGLSSASSGAPMTLMKLSGFN